MKSLIFALGLLSFAPAFANHTTHGDHPAVHGMAVVGTERVYLSHLPMFHSPHDYQVILEADFDRASYMLYRNSKRASDEPLYTIAPASAVLSQIAQAGATFSASLFRGHFERGGTLIQSHAKVTIKRVLYFKKFQPGAAKPSEAKFLLFGNLTEQFMAHLISAKPDFDQILSVQLGKDAATGIANRGSLEVVLPGVSNLAPLAAPLILKANTESQVVEVQTKQTLYHETGDLEL